MDATMLCALAPSRPAGHGAGRPAAAAEAEAAGAAFAGVLAAVPPPPSAIAAKPGPDGGQSPADQPGQASVPVSIPTTTPPSGVTPTLPAVAEAAGTGLPGAPAAPPTPLATAAPQAPDALPPTGAAALVMNPQMASLTGSDSALPSVVAVAQGTSASIAGPAATAAQVSSLPAAGEAKHGNATVTSPAGDVAAAAAPPTAGPGGVAPATAPTVTIPGVPEAPAPAISGAIATPGELPGTATDFTSRATGGLQSAADPADAAGAATPGPDDVQPVPPFEAEPVHVDADPLAAGEDQTPAVESPQAATVLPVTPPRAALQAYARLAESAPGTAREAGEAAPGAGTAGRPSAFVAGLDRALAALAQSAAPGADTGLEAATLAAGTRGRAASATGERAASIRAQVAEQLVRIGVDPRAEQKLAIRLQPENLGQVDAEFRASDDRLTVVLRTETVEAAQALRTGARELGEAIADRSGRFQHVEVRVEVRDGGAARQDKADDRQPDQKHDGRQDGRRDGREDGRERRPGARDEARAAWARAWADRGQEG